MNLIKKLLKEVNTDKTVRIKEIDHALMMYGFDAWGTDAFSNIDKMKRLKAEKQRLLNPPWHIRALTQFNHYINTKPSQDIYGEAYEHDGISFCFVCGKDGMSGGELLSHLEVYHEIGRDARFHIPTRYPSHYVRLRKNAKPTLVDGGGVRKER